MWAPPIPRNTEISEVWPVPTRRAQRVNRAVRVNLHFVGTRNILPLALKAWIRAYDIKLIVKKETILAISTLFI